MIHAILGTALTAAGEARKAALVTFASLLPALALFIFFIHLWGGEGAALSNALIILITGVSFAVMVWRRFNTLVSKRSACNIIFSGCLMFLVFTWLSRMELIFILACAGALLAYLVALIASHEITRQDLAVLIPWMKVESCPVADR
jgi:O-antigen/teichoic acid export membrane protein